MENPSEKKTRKSDDLPSWVSGMGGDQKYLGIGIQAGISVAFYLGVGLLLDKWLGTLPWLTLLGALFGLIGMFYLFVRMNKELNRNSRQSKAEKGFKKPD